MSHSSPVIGSQFSRDGRRLVTLTESFARVWDAITGDPVSPMIPIESGFELKPRVEISNDGTLVAVHYPYRENKALPVAVHRPQAAIVWDSAGRRIFTLPSKIDSGKRVFEGIENNGAVFESAMSPDGRFLVAGVESSGEIITFVIDTGKRLQCMQAFRGHLYGLGIAPASQTIGIATSDGLSRELDILTGAPIGPALRHPDYPYSIGLNLNGGKMVTIAGDKRLRLWDTRTGDLLAIATGNASSKEGCWFSRDDSTVQYMNKELRWQYRVPTYLGPKEAVTRATQLITGRFMDPSGGLSDLGPNEFMENRAAYRKAWMDWQGLSSDPAQQP